MVTGLHQNDRSMSLNNTMYNNLAFKKKNARIDWRKIAAVDLDRIARDTDISSLQENLDHITFCNIDAEIDTRSMDPNYVKLFKIAQYIIEYLVYSQNYLTEIIDSIDGQLSSTLKESETLKKQNEKLQKELVEVKKENKKRKKMIETQQTLMSVTSSNYHQCAYCSKVFLNENYLQAHLHRRHPEVNSAPVLKQASEFEKELERIKERLRITESELMMERTSRLNMGAIHVNTQKTEDTSGLIKQIEELKNNEIKQQKEEFRKTKEALKKEINELSEKNAKFEMSIKDLQDRLSKQSHVGWMKDDIDLEKDMALKLKQEIEKQKEIISNYEKHVKMLEEQKSKWKNKENSVKQKYLKQIAEKDEEIASLKAKLTELQNAIGKSDHELAIRIQELQEQLQMEQGMRIKAEGELKNRPPLITPRNSTIGALIPSIPGPVKSTSPQPAQPTKPTQPVQSSLPQKVDIYLEDFCPLTQKELETNPKHLDKFRRLAIDLFEKELDEFGIELNEKGLSLNDYKSKMNAIRNFRSERSDDMVKFSELRNVFSELSAKHAQQRLTSSLRSSSNRVHFKKEISQKKFENYYDDDPEDETSYFHDSMSQSKSHNNNRSKNNHNENSEETDDDVSLSNALESDEDDTEPTKSILTESNHQNKVVWRNKENLSPRKSPKVQGNFNPDEISDLESISQLLSERSSRKKTNSEQFKKLPNTRGTPSVSELKKKLEKQIDNSSKKGFKPAPNAVPVGFQVENGGKHEAEEGSFVSISDLDNEARNGQRPRSGVRSSLQDSQSSSVWVSESHSVDLNPNQHPNDRPATANSSKTLNFDSDEVENVE